MKIRLLLIMSLVVALAGLNVPATGDDTEIYLDPQSDGGEPLIMLSLDYRSNLNSSVCQGYVQNGNIPDVNSTCGEAFYEASNGGVDTLFLPADPNAIVFFEVFRAILKVVMDPLDGVKIGLMINHNNNNNCAGPQTPPSGNSNGCSNGGYIYLGLESMEENDTNGKKAAFHTKLAALPLPQGNVSHSYQGAELFFEFFRYLTGQGIYNGHNGYTDFDSGDDGLNLDDSNQVPDRSNVAWDTSAEVDAPGNQENTLYDSPLDENCTHIFTINFMFAVSNQENDSNNAIEESKANGGMEISVSNNNAFVDVIAGLHNADLGDNTYGTVGELEGEQKVTSYFFIDPSQINQANQKGYALAGGTVNAIPLDGSQAGKVRKDLEAVFNDILSVSTTFVSATAPVNTFNRSESLENVFFGMFEPEVERQWNGNVKRLRLHVTNEGTLMVVDALQDVDNNPIDAINGLDGRIKSNALSFWTDASGVDVADELGSDADQPLNGWDEDKGEISGRDGKSVNRGGAGQKVSGFLNDAPSLTNASGRKVLTEPASYTNGTAATMMAFNADDTTAEALWSELCGSIQPLPCTTWAAAATMDSDNDGINDQVEAEMLIGFQRGVDVYDHDGDGDTTDSRPWLFADILHAQPIPLNYGTLGGYSTTNPNLYVLAAGNDGYIRGIRNNTTGGVAVGNEGWAFMPRELMPIIGELAQNNAGVHPYGADGGITVYTHDDNKDGTLSGVADKAIAFFGLRRGGKAYYALDLADPATPKLLWKIEKQASPGDDFYELGETWSKARVGMLDWGSGVKPVVIFAGGYDIDKDDRPVPPLAGTDDDEGNALFIVDALTGDLVWKAIKGTGSATSTVFQHSALKDSIPSDVTIMDSNGDGVTDRIYVGDTGGVVWRVDLPGNDPDDGTTPWTINSILSVGRHTGSDPDRRFYHRPDIVPTRDGFGDYDGVMIGSGNRPNPKQNNFVSSNDRFFVYKDRQTQTGYPTGTSAVTAANLADMTTRVGGDLDLTVDGNGECLDTATNSDCETFRRGWFLDLVIGQDRNPAVHGEKMLSTSLTYKGVIFFTTYLPNVGVGVSCGPVEGESYTYVVNIEDGSPFFKTFDENSDRAKNTGRGIGSDPIVICKGGKCFPGPGNLAPDEEFREGFPQNLNKTFWYEETL